MLSGAEFVRQSLELHLFFGRIMKEHSFFLEVGFTPRDSKLNQRADLFRREFDKFLNDVIYLSNGVVRKDVLESGEVMTPYTLKAEQASAFYTGVNIATELTKAEQNLLGAGYFRVNTDLEQTVHALNQRAIGLVASLIEFKSMILSDVLSCKMMTGNYPLLLASTLTLVLSVVLINRLVWRRLYRLAEDQYRME
jgi:hypothetical protein